MSASWRSEPRGRRLAPVGSALLILALAGLAPTVDAAARRDTTERVSRIRVSDRGILVDGTSLRDTVREDSDDWSRWRDRRQRLRDRIRERVRANGDIIDIQDSGTGIVRIFSDAHVPAGQVVDGEVVAVMGSVTVEGTVTRDVVAVMGSVHLAPGARVDGDVVSIGGTIEQPEGVTIRGESVQLGFLPFTFGLPGPAVILFAVGTGWLVSMFTGWIFALLFPTGMLRVGTVVERRPAASFFLGVISLPGFFVALILLCITVIGIPLAVLLPMVYMLVGYAGQLTATAVLGSRVVRRPLADGMMLPLFVGTVLVGALVGSGALMLVGSPATRSLALFLLLLGGMLQLGLGALGTGAFLLSRLGTRPREVVWRGHAPRPSDATIQQPVSPPATG